MNYTPATLLVLDVPARLLARAELDLKKCVLPTELTACAIRYVAALNRFQACAGYVRSEQAQGREPSLHVIYAGSFNGMATDEMDATRRLFSDMLKLPEYALLAEVLAAAAPKAEPVKQPEAAKAKKKPTPKKSAKKKAAKAA